MIEILYEDDYFVIVNKPAKLQVYKSKLSNDKDYLSDKMKSLKGNNIYPVYRIEKAISGLVIFSKDKETTQKIFNLIKENKIKKGYSAIVRGWTTEGIIDKEIKDTDEKFKFSKNKVKALTSYKTIKHIEIPYFIDKYPQTRYSLVKIYPKTNYFHQIRRNFLSISHPILGDTTYGKTKHNNFLRNNINLNRLMLSADSLEFVHPYNDKEINLNIRDKDFDLFFKKVKEEYSATVKDV